MTDEYNTIACARRCSKEHSDDALATRIMRFNIRHALQTGYETEIG